jgi:hypothetical protein
MGHGWQTMANAADTLTKEQAVVHRLKELEFGHFGRQREGRTGEKVTGGLAYR